MRFKIGSILLLLCAATFVQADDDATVIKSTDKAALEAADGKTVAVTGKVTSAKWSKSGKVLNIEFDNDAIFVAASFAKTKDKLDSSFNGDFAKTLNGAVVKLHGKLAKYGGKDNKFDDASQMIISMANQVTIVTPAPTTQSATTQPADAPTTAPAAGM